MAQALLLLFAGLLLGPAAASAPAAAPASVSVEAPVESVPPAWRQVGPAAKEHPIELTFAVKQQGLEELRSTLLRVSDPSSEQYGQHLSLEEVHRLTAPAPEHLQAVEAFLRGHGLEPRRATANGDLVTVTASIEAAERLLSTQYVELSHTSGVKVNRALAGYKLPPAVAASVDFVAPTTHIPGVRRPSTSRENGLNSSAFGFNTPKNLRKLYSVDVEGKAADNKQAVTAFLEQGYGSRSLHMFWRMYCGGISCGKGEPKLVGDAIAGSAGVESMLDIETVTGVAGNVESEFWGFAGRSPESPANEPFLKWLEKLSSTSDAEVPKIFSTSYGEDEGTWSYPAAQRLNVEFQKAGVRGISLLFASGDSGANCQGGKFVPQGPGSSPYVTAVGGTAPGASWPSPGSEKAIGLSSGGFSNYWPMPEWQKDAVNKYMTQSGLPEPSRGYNTSGRAYPDISAQATNFFVIAGSPSPGVSGTSCASPTAAGLFALLNDLRLQQGKSTLGFLNPLIYKSMGAFNDITEGSSSGCGFFGGGGWPAKPGWDAVTGMGTPNYASLAKIVSGLPAGRGTAAAQPTADLVV